ncbi:MAG: insulinase family protein [Planctomycetaceae bacterium]|nr:insulinase family protein [Planctomycetaceae bacterium]
MKFQEHTLSNGLRIIGETNQTVHSVAAGFFVRTGSRDETAAVSGVSHFLEHMAFKGNEKFTADDVNRVFDEIGAKYNASTSEEITMYYAAVLPEYLESAMDLLSALMMPSLRQDDFDMEKNVILEEIGMYEDQPSFTCYDTIMSTHFAGHPLGQSILGTNESITALTAEQMREYHRNHYHAGNITLAIAGRCDFEHAVQLAERYCSSIPAGHANRILLPVEAKPSTQMVYREGSVQQHIMQMGEGPRSDDPLRFAAELLAVVVGDDSGSRLFWDLVDPGHAEAADIGYSEYDGAGTWMTYLSCQPEQVEQNLAAMKRIFDEVSRDGITAEELEQARNKVASRIVLRGERPMGRLSSLGNNWVYRNHYRSVEEDLQTIRSITVKEIREVLTKFPLKMITTAGVGPLKELTAF